MSESRKDIKLNYEIPLQYESGTVAVWKRALMVSCDSVWCTIIIAGSIFSVLESLYRSIHGACVGRDVTLFAIVDIIFALDIILYLSCLSVPRLNIPEVNLGVRTKWTVIFEIISLLPVHILIPTETQRECNIHCVFRVTRALKVVRIFSYITMTGKYLTKPALVVAIQLLFTTFFATTSAQAFYYNSRLIVYEYQTDPYDAGLLFKNITKSIIGGGKSDVPGDVTWELSILLGIIVSLYFANSRTAFFVVTAVNSNTQKVLFKNRYLTASRRFLSYGTPIWLVNSANRIFKEFWEQRGGYESGMECLKILPPAVESIIQFSVTYHAFRHSRLFRRMGWVFLRHISKTIEVRYYFPGEYIYRLNQHKNKMMYLVKGVIQILSDEDGVTPIFQFTSGTCFGDSTLFTSYKSTTIVQCKTYCEFYVLKMKNFQREVGKFKTEHLFLKKIISKRFENAKTLKNLWNGGNDRQSRSVSTIWLKNTLHRLMSDDKESILKHEFQNIHLVNEYNQKHYESKIFTALYLDTLAIDERLSLSKEFTLKNNFPIKPHSFGSYIWEGIVIIFTILLSIAIPYTAFVSETIPSWYLPLKNISTVVFLIDVIAILFTKISNLHFDFKENLMIRFQTTYFWFAVFAAFPIEIFTPLILEELNNKTTVVMHLNRLWKIIRLVRYINNRQKCYKANLLITWLLILTLTRFYWTYTIYFVISYYYGEGVYTQLELFVGAFLYTMGVPGITPPKHWIFTLSKFVILALWIWITAGICSCLILQEKNIQDVQEVAFQLIEIFREHNLKVTYERLQNYLTAQYLDNGSFHFYYDEAKSMYVSKHIKGDIMSSLVLENLEKTKCFSLFNEDVLLTLSQNCNIKLFPPDEIIIQSGDISDALYILRSGSCDVFNCNGKFIKSLDSTEEINFLEVIFETPSVNTVICKTNCTVISILKTVFMSVMLRNWNQWDEMKEILSNSHIRENLMEKLKNLEMKKIRKEEVFKIKNFYTFKNVNILGSFEEYDYYHPFDTLYIFSFVRFFLMKVTFHPDGTFIHIWECQRNFFAILSCLGSFCIPILKSKMKFYLLLLDLTVVVDMYIRLHISYYNEQGLLVTHPLKTSIHYLTHGFLIDLIGIWPFRYFYKFKVVTEVFFNATRLLQLHRYVQFLQYYKNDILTPTNRLTTIMYIPLILILTNILACTLFLLECEVTEGKNHFYPLNNITLICYECHEDALLYSSNYKGEISLFKTHWFLLWVLTSLITDRPFIGYKINSIHSYIILAFVKVFALYINIMIFCRIFTYFSFRDTDLIETQISMKHLKRWLNSTVRSPKLIKVTMETQQLKWERRNHLRIVKFVKPFNPVLRADVLQEYFFRFFNNKNFFGKNFKWFYRSMLKHVSIDVIIKSGYLQTLNDVDEYLYVLIDGLGEVILADGMKLVYLGEGSMFGNLTDYKKSRLKVSIIAVTNVQILKIKTQIWNEKIKFYPDLEQEYHTYCNRCLYFIKVDPSKKFLERLKQMKEISRYASPILMGTSSSNTRLSNFITKCYLFFPCYVGVLTDLYQLSVSDYSTPVYFLQTFCDIIFAVDIIMRDRISFVNRYGFKIRNLTILRKLNRKNTFYTWIYFITLFPLDLIIYHLPTERYQTCIIFSILRSPKLLRIVLFNAYLLKTRTGLLANLFWYRMVHIFGWLIAMLQCSVFLMSFMCYMEENINVHVPTCKEIFYLPRDEKFSLYIRYMFILVKTYAGMLQSLYYPISANTYAMFTAMMLAMNFLFCIISARTFSTFYEWFVIKCRYYHLYEHLQKFMDFERISIAIKSQALNYVQTVWFMYQGEYFPNLVKYSTPYLKDALYNHSYSFLLQKHDIFSSCHDDFLRQVVQKLESRVYLGGQFVQFSGAIDNSMYFLYEGQITVLDDNSIGRDANVVWLKKGACFGVYSGLQRGKPHEYSYRCVIRCVILSLCLDDWEYLFDFFPATKELIYTALETYFNVC